jgi:hypothetical protein
MFHSVRDTSLKKLRHLLINDNGKKPSTQVHQPRLSRSRLKGSDDVSHHILAAVFWIIA